MHGLRNPILITLTTLLLSLPAAADQAASEVGTLLEPGPDGAYALPLLDRRDPLPLELDPGEAPFRLVELAFDREGRSLRATFRHAGSKPATAWAIELEAFAGEESLGSSTLTQDWYHGIDEDLASRAPAERLRPRLHGDGAFHPGQVHVIDLGLMVPDPGASPGEVRLRLSIPLVVFGDTSFTGSPKLAREILGARAAAADEQAYWSARLEELLKGAGSARELAQAVAELRRELAVEAPDLPASAQAIRANFLQNLPDADRTRSRSDSLLTELESLASWYRSELRKDLRHVPAELPEAPGAARDGARLQGKVDGGWEGDSGELNCDCGGGILTSRTQAEHMNCSSSAGWTIDETWNFTCQREDGTTLNLDSSGTLHGVGGCLEDVFCVADKQCPPKFVGPSVSQTDFEHHWGRSVTNARVLVGLCTARCEVTTGSSLTHCCPCSPRPDTQCFADDGCPILIETGAGGFKLTDLDGGVAFDIDADGLSNRVSWPVVETDDAWLALDRDGNGSIDDGAELFGDSTPQLPSSERNGFLALAVFDRLEHGGNGDGQISAADAVFPDLLLWLDRNHDGLSDPGELSSLAAEGIVAIELDYRESRRRDRYGNRFRYSAGVWYASGARRLAVDVFLLHE